MNDDRRQHSWVRHKGLYSQHSGQHGFLHVCDVCSNSVCIAFSCLPGSLEATQCWAQVDVAQCSGYVCITVEKT